MNTVYQIAWWDSKPTPPNAEGWRLMPALQFTSKGKGIGRLQQMKSLYPFIKFSLQKISVEILAQIQ